MKYDFVVVYDKDGRLYTYKMTIEEMQKILSERGNMRELPWRVWAIVDGEMQKLNVAQEEKKASTD